MGKNKILLVVAARGGSKGIKNKNLMDLCGKPLIAHTILQAKRWGGADKIICSTDSNEIAEAAKAYGAEVPFMRPKELAGDGVGKLEVLKHALQATEDITGERYEILIDLDATAPIRKTEDIQGALDLFIQKKPKTVFSVVPCRKNPYFNMVEVKDDGQVILVKSRNSAPLRRQDAPKVYDMNASIYIYDRDYLIDDRSRTAISDRSLIWIMGELSAFDIDNEGDFQYVEYLVSKGLVSL